MTQPEGAVPRRLVELEREYRRMRRLTLLLVVGVAALLGTGVAIILIARRSGIPGTVADVVAARQFVLRGADGTIRGIWGTEPDGALRLVLQDTGGRARAKLNLLTDGSSGLTFSDSAGHPRAVFALLPDQTASIVFADADGKTRSVLGISADGNPTLVFADRQGETRAGLGVDGRGAGILTVLDRNGRDLTQPELDPDPAADTIGDTTARPPAAKSQPRPPARRR